MLVERIDLFDFKAVLTPEEFGKIRRVVDRVGCSIEAVFMQIFLDGLNHEINELDLKE